MHPQYHNTDYLANVFKTSEQNLNEIGNMYLKPTKVDYGRWKQGQTVLVRCTLLKDGWMKLNNKNKTSVNLSHEVLIKSDSVCRK